MESKTGWRLRWALHQKKWYGKWHLYLGVIAGAILVVVGLTGSILVFQDEIDEALNPELFRVLETSKPIPLPDIIPMVKEKHPQLSFDYAMQDPMGRPNQAYRFFNFKSEEEFFVNPYTGELSGKRIHESSFVHIVTEIHRTLLVPVVGRYIVGLATLCLLILTITGMRLWLPAKWKQLRAALTVKFNTSFKRQNYDWHNVLGFYSAPVVTLLSLTGFCITFSPVVIALLFLLNGQSPQGVASLLGAQSAYTAGAKPIAPAALVNNTDSVLNGSRVVGIALPADSVGNYRLDIISPGLPRSGKREMIILDQYSGKVLLNSRRDFPSAGQAYLSWLTPLHYGSFGGLPTRILALIGGLIPLLLFITGFIIWWPRYTHRKQKPAARPRQVTSQSAPSPRPGFGPSFAKGLRYAGWMALLSGVMGLVYGLPSGIVWQPAAFSIGYTCLLVLMNFLVAAPLMLFNLPFLLFGKYSRGIQRYFALSLAMVVVFVPIYLLLMNTGIKIF